MFDRFWGLISVAPLIRKVIIWCEIVVMRSIFANSLEWIQYYTYGVDSFYFDPSRPQNGE